MASVKVAVRVRPFNKRESEMGATCIIEMDGKRTSIQSHKLMSYLDPGDPEGTSAAREQRKDFFFDHSYWSFDHSSPNYVSQEQVFNELGSEVLTAAYQGYNACVFAYGQTGSGKTFTMMGYEGCDGLIPRICEELFSYIKDQKHEKQSFRTEVSYLEIYNEKVRDLLCHSVAKKGAPLHSLRVREHPKDGPYVQDLSKHIVVDYNAIKCLMMEGNRQRTTAATQMNDTSSRSHAIFTISFTQAKFFQDMPSETVSKINLVDLAGSERANSTGAVGIRLKEGGNINKSLVTLGSVISILADNSTQQKRSQYIPYRDSVLTWLLKESLGGNSKTIMMAAISPADCNYSETLSTLRYAHRAKNIVNQPTVNEDLNVKLIRDLRAEIDELRRIINQGFQNDAKKAAEQQLSENEHRLVELTDQWKDKWKDTQKLMQESELALQRHFGSGIKMDTDLPHLVIVNDDVLNTGIVMYQLKKGHTLIGRGGDVSTPDILIDGSDTETEHCILETTTDSVVLRPLRWSQCSINGTPISSPTRLQQGDLVLLGHTNMFRYNNPAEAQALREKKKRTLVTSLSSSFSTSKLNNSDQDSYRNREPDGKDGDLAKDLELARKELDRQKGDEERNLLILREEITKQVQEESKKLLETRRDLEQHKARYETVEQTNLELRRVVDEMERAQQSSSELHRQKINELESEIGIKDKLLADQTSRLQSLQQDCEAVILRGEKERKLLVDAFSRRRAITVEKINHELCRIFSDVLPPPSQGIRQEKQAELSQDIQMYLDEFFVMLDDLLKCRNNLFDPDSRPADLATGKADAFHLQEDMEKIDNRMSDMFSCIMSTLQSTNGDLCKQHSIASALRERYQTQFGDQRRLLEEKLSDQLQRVQELSEQAEVASGREEASLLTGVRFCSSILDKWLALKEGLAEPHAYQQPLVASLESLLASLQGELASMQEVIMSNTSTGNVDTSSLTRLVETEMETISQLQALQRDCFTEGALSRFPEKLHVVSNLLQQREDLRGGLSLAEHTVSHECQSTSKLSAARTAVSSNELSLMLLNHAEDRAVSRNDVILLDLANKLRDQLETSGQGDTAKQLQLYCSQMDRMNADYREDLVSTQARLDSELRPLVEFRDRSQMKLGIILEARSALDRQLYNLRGLPHTNPSTDGLETSSFTRSFVEAQIGDCVYSTPAKLNFSLASINHRGESPRAENLPQDSCVSLKDELARLKAEKNSLLTQLDRVQAESLQEQQEFIMQIRKREDAIRELRDLAAIEIDRLQERVQEQDRELKMLQDSLRRYTSMISSNGCLEDSHDAEVSRIVDAFLDDTFSPPEISPPPSPVGRFLSSYRLDKLNLVQASIPRYFLRGASGTAYHVYEIQMSVGQESWVIYRRYSEFRQFHITLREQYSCVGDIDFPGKCFFGNRSEEFVKTRRYLLEKYLCGVLVALACCDGCPVNSSQNKQITLHDFQVLHSFFKPGSLEPNRFGPD